MTKSREEYIREFHEAFGASVHEEPSVELLALRKTLIFEETRELIADIDTAMAHIEKGETVPNALYINMLKEMADVQVVLSGMSVSLKPLHKLDEAFRRVHQSNMSKLDSNGKPILRDDGKILKGPHYAPPDLSDLV